MVLNFFFASQSSRTSVDVLNIERKETKEVDSPLSPLTLPLSRRHLLYLRQDEEKNVEVGRSQEGEKYSAANGKIS